MRTLSFFCFAVMATFLASCLQEKSNEPPTQAMINQSVVLEPLCRTIAESGDIRVELRKLKKQHHLLLKLSSDDPKKNVTKIRNAVDRISQISDNIMMISQGPWLEEAFQQELSWKLPKVKKISEVKPSHILFMGKDFSAWEKDIRLIQDEDATRLIFARKTHALDLCQLQSTLIITVKVNDQWYKLIVKGEENEDN